MKKTCFKCGENKVLSSFYKNKSMKDGHVNKCKSCTRKDVIENRNKNIDYYRKRDRERGNLPHRVSANMKYSKEYRAKNPEKYKAHYAVSNAIRSGKLIKPKLCEHCNKEAYIEAHHCDYSKPLDVMWLCKPCHSEWHKVNDYVA